MSKEHEVRVSELLGSKFELNFCDKKFRMNGWGEADNYVELSPSSYLVLEVETVQKHPNTNVLKIWPYLEENEDTKIVLVQAYFPDSPGVRSNRGRMAEWTAKKMQRSLEKRFSYCRIIVSKDFRFIEKGIEDLYQLLRDEGAVA